MFPFQLWIDLPISTRIKIASMFGVKKHGSTHVAENRIVDDGYRVRELADALSLVSLQAHFNVSIMDYIVLWEALLNEATGQAVEFPQTGMVVNMEPEKIIKKKPGRPKKIQNA